ncbi:MAG: acyltransferase [Gemmatimonadales bacterium]
MTAVPLSPIEYVFTGVGSYPIEFVFAYDVELETDRLEASFEQTVSHFPRVRSQLERASEAALEFHHTVDGATFTTATISESFEARYVFLDPVDSVERQPLTRIKLTHTPAGTVLGASLSHTLVDGFSFFHFLSSWAKIHRGKEIHPPSHDRRFLLPDPAPPQARITADEVRASCGMFWDERRAAIDRRNLLWDRYLFSEEEAKALLAEARRNCEGRLSFNDVVAAWLWKRYFGARTADSSRIAYLSCPVDFRRIVRSVPRTYFGCAVTLTTASLDRAVLANASLGLLAGKVREAVAAVDEEYVAKGLRVLESLRRQEGLGVFEHCHVIHPRDGILVTNLSRLPVYELDFGAGPPVAFDIMTSAPGGAVVLPAAGGLDVRVCRSNEEPGDPRAGAQHPIVRS